MIILYYGNYVYSEYNYIYDIVNPLSNPVAEVRLIIKHLDHSPRTIKLTFFLTKLHHQFFFNRLLSTFVIVRLCK